jgi:hypothetical protein
MTTGIRRFILRFIVGLVTFLIGVAAAMAIAGFSPFEGQQIEQRNYRHYRYKKSCNFNYRSWNAPPLAPPAPLAPLAPPAVRHVGTVHLKGPDGITVTVEK